MSDKWKVCPDCEGDGNDKEAEIEFTANDVYEWYGDDVEAQEDFRRSYMRGDYSKPCQTCKGQRVILRWGLRNGTISYSELYELQSLAEYIDPITLPDGTEYVGPPLDEPCDECGVPAGVPCLPDPGEYEEDE